MSVGICIKEMSITDVEADAIVNAANEDLLEGGGVCGAIFKAAGRERLRYACEKIGHCDTGSAVITDGFDTKAKYIIHAVGSVWRGGKEHEKRLLYSAYWRSLELAIEKGCKSICFPLISSGIFGFPKEIAWEVAIDACVEFFKYEEGDDFEIIFAVFGDDVYNAGMNALRKKFICG